jgi:hypothetical protein
MAMTLDEWLLRPPLEDERQPVDESSMVASALPLTLILAIAALACFGPVPARVENRDRRRCAARRPRR